MANAKQQRQAQPRYGVTLLIEGSQLKTMAKQAKQTFGDALVKVEKVEKMPPAPGEWTLTEERPDGTYRNKVWENEDGREVVWSKPYEEDGFTIGGEYRTRDQWGTLGDFTTLEEAQAATRPIITQEEIDKLAYELALRVARSEESLENEITDAAEKYIRAKRIVLPPVEEEEEGKAAPEYTVTLHIKGSVLPAVKKRAEAAFGKQLKKVTHVRRYTSNQDLLDDAKEMVEGAVEIIEELQGDMEDRRDNTPENFQQGETYEMVEQAVDALESLKEEVEGVLPSFDNVEFPGW